MLKFDDQFPLHRKVSGLTDAAFRLHVEAIFWSRRHRTDGVVAQADLVTVGRFRRPEGLAAELVGRGCWHRTGVPVECAECAGRHNGALNADGWVIHGYADWQELAAQLAATSEARKQSGRAGGIRSGEVRRKRKATVEQLASTLLPNERTPEPPRPPTGGSGGRARGRDPVARHAFVDDGSGASCADCGFLRQNKVHPAA